MNTLDVTTARRMDEKLDNVKESLSAVNVVLGTLGLSLRNIDAHLTTLNGSVARHEKRFSDFSEDMANLKQQIAVDEAILQTRLAVAAEVGGKYQKWLVPIAKYVLAAIAILAAEHFSQISKVLKP